jgi:hypothetical protein
LALVLLLLLRRSLAMFYVCLFVGEQPIPANTELTYDYGYAPVPSHDADGNPTQPRVVCHCGAATCRKVLL